MITRKKKIYIPTVAVIGTDWSAVNLLVEAVLFTYAGKVINPSRLPTAIG